MKQVRVFYYLFVLNMTLAFLVYFLLPDYRHYLIMEDSLIENIGAFLFLTTSMLAFIFFIKNQKNRITFIIISALGALAFLDEISFGKRIIGYDSPSINNKTIDSGHDMIDVIISSIKSTISTTQILILVVVLISFTMPLLYKYRTNIHLTFKKHKNNPIALMLFSFFLLVGCALLIDLELLQTSLFNLVMLEELLEMNAAAAFLFLFFSVYHENKRADHLKQPAL